MFKFYYFCVLHLLIITFLPYVFGEKYDCSLDKTVILKLNEIVFFETTNYPSNDLENHCRLSFSMTESNETHRLVIAYKTAIEFAEKTFVVSDGTFSLGKYLSDNLDGGALQGFVTHEDIDAGCPLEGLSNPLMIHDENEIIQIRSTYYENEKRIRPCKWEFETTINYDFKIVIEILNISSSTFLTISNSSEIILVERMAMLYHPYYNRDSYIQILLSLDNSTTQLNPEIEFQAYISVVKKEYKKIDNYCQMFSYTGYIMWTLYGGYQNNAECNLGFLILPNHVVSVFFESYDLEKGVDHLQYSVNGEKFTVILEEEMLNNFAIEADEKSKNVWFQFVSDGSVQKDGFLIKFNDYVCECASAIILCKRGYSGIMTGSTHYCSNMKCNFTFESCPQYYLKIFVSSDEGDVFKISSYNETILEINKYNFKTSYFFIFFNPENVYTLEAITSYSTKFRNFAIEYIHDYNHTLNDRVILTRNNLFSIVDNSVNDLTEVSHDLDESDLHFVLYCNQYNAPLRIYNNKSLTINYSSKNCFGNLNPYQCILPYKSFAVSFGDNFHPLPYSFLAIRLSKQSKGCVLEENIFVAKNIDESIVGISNSEGPCVLKLLISNDLYFYITYIWTNSIQENVKVYVGMNTSHLLFEFNTKTMKKWKYVSLFSSHYFIYIPSNMTFWMKLKRYNSQTINNLQIPFQSIVATPFFNTFNDRHHPITYERNFLSYNISDTPLIFTIFHYKMLKDDKFYFMVNNEILKINYTAGISFTFKNQLVHLFYDMYSQTDIFDANEGALLYVESL